MMDAQTLEALKGSIEKWERIVAGTGKDEGPRNCPLCQTFRVGDSWNGFTCRGCPVAERAGEDGCGNTPYDDYEASEGDSESEQTAARAELEFLRSLLPKEEAKR